MMMFLRPAVAESTYAFISLFKFDFKVVLFW